MTRVAYRLLRGYLRRYAYLYAFFGLAQFTVVELYWLKGVPRVAAPAALLSFWGFAVALNARSLVWRSLPLNVRDAGVFRWWAIAGAPGIFVTIYDLVIWASQLTTPRLPAPGLASLLESIAVGWAAVGLVAAFPILGRRIRRPLLAGAATLLVAACGVIYGVPSYSVSPAAYVAFVAFGMSSLIFSAIHAARGDLWRWPDVSAHRQEANTKDSTIVGPRFGIYAVLIPLCKRTAAFAFLATALLIVLYQVFPGAGELLFWSYFISISTTGFLLTYRIRSAIQILRILPLSSKKLAAMLQFFGALPGIATLGLAFLVNSTLLHLELDPTEFAMFALIIIAAQALPLSSAPNSRNRALFTGLALFQRIFYPTYVGIFVVHHAGLYAKWWWFKWPLVAAGIALCVIGYCVLVLQLRAGIRPSSNETIFSAR
jgi:hypothetical protein